jgi:sarcosine oxidase subunit beta
LAHRFPLYPQSHGGHAVTTPSTPAPPGAHLPITPSSSGAHRNRRNPTTSSSSARGGRGLATRALFGQNHGITNVAVLGGAGWPAAAWPASTP